MTRGSLNKSAIQFEAAMTITITSTPVAVLIVNAMSTKVRSRLRRCTSASLTPRPIAREPRLRTIDAIAITPRSCGVK